MFAVLSDYVDHQLDPAMCAELKAHLDSCKPCIGYLAPGRNGPPTEAAPRSADRSEGRGPNQEKAAAGHRDRLRKLICQVSCVTDFPSQLL